MNVPLLTLWDFFAPETYGMAEYFRGVQGDGSEFKFEQIIFHSRLGRRLPRGLKLLQKQIYFPIANRRLLGTLLEERWVLGGQQFLSLIPPRYLQQAAAVVFDLLELDFPDYGQRASYLDLVRRNYGPVTEVNQIITISNYSKQRIVAHYSIDPDRILVAPVGINRTDFSPKSKKESNTFREAFGIPKSAFVVLYVGSEQRRKNLLSLVKALRIFARSVKELKFVKIGRSQSPIGRRLFEESIRESGLGGNTLVLDNVTRQQLACWYSLADIFVFPSVGEGFGIPALEAMSCCLPLITTSCTAIPEVTGTSALTVVDAFSPTAWADAMLRLYESPNLRKKLGELGRARSLEFSWETPRRAFKEALNSARS